MKAQATLVEMSNNRNGAVEEGDVINIWDQFPAALRQTLERRNIHELLPPHPPVPLAQYLLACAGCVVAATAAGLADPAIFGREAGTAQERPVRPRAGWLQLYGARFPGRLPSGLPTAKSNDRRLGGDVRVLQIRIDEIRSLH